MNVQRNVSWSLSPADGCDDSVKLLLMISSGPRNAQQRQACRDRVKVGHLDIVKIIQMGAKLSCCQTDRIFQWRRFSYFREILNCQMLLTI